MGSRRTPLQTWMTVALLARLVLQLMASAVALGLLWLLLGVTTAGAQEARGKTGGCCWEGRGACSHLGTR